MVELSLQTLVKFRILIFCSLYWLLSTIMTIICLASTQWVTGKNNGLPVSFGLFRFCIYTTDGEILLNCASYTSSGWVDFTKALLIMPLLMLWMFIPCAVGLAVTEPTAKCQLSIARGNYRIHLYLLTPLYIGATQAFIKSYLDYTFLRNLRYGSAFYTSIAISTLAILQPIIYGILYKVSPSCLGLSAAAAEEEDEQRKKQESAATDKKSANDFDQVEIGIENQTTESNDN